jgi:c-di-GMP-binding flagellar brake protein YcgR
MNCNALGEEQREAQRRNYMSASATGQIQYRGFHNRDSPKRTNSENIVAKPTSLGYIA